VGKKKKTPRAKGSDFDNNPFKHLHGVAVSDPEENSSLLPAAEPGVEKYRSFSDEMRMLGVEKLNHTEGFEEDKPLRPVLAEEFTDGEGDQSDEAIFLTAMGDLEVTFEDNYSVEDPGFKAMPKRIKLVRQGKLTPDASLDLHGLQRTEVIDKLRQFFQRAHHHGWKTLLVITGKGLHSETGEPVLRNEVERYLSLEGRKQVIEWSRAPRQYGGNGALILFLPQS